MKRWTCGQKMINGKDSIGILGESYKGIVDLRYSDA